MSEKLLSRRNFFKESARAIGLGAAASVFLEACRANSVEEAETKTVVTKEDIKLSRDFLFFTISLQKYFPEMVTSFGLWPYIQELSGSNNPNLKKRFSVFTPYSILLGIEPGSSNIYSLNLLSWRDNKNFFDLGLNLKKNTEGKITQAFLTFAIDQNGNLLGMDKYPLKKELSEDERKSIAKEKFGFIPSKWKSFGTQIEGTVQTIDEDSNPYHIVEKTMHINSLGNVLYSYSLMDQKDCYTCE